MKQVLWPALAFSLCICIGLYAGVDFLQRGADQAFWALEGLLAAVAAFFHLRVSGAVPMTMSESRALRMTCSVITALIVFALGWYLGIDIAARGSAQAYVLASALGVAWLTWTAPLWKTEKTNAEGGRV